MGSVGTYWQTDKTDASCEVIDSGVATRVTSELLGLRVDECMLVVVNEFAENLRQARLRCGLSQQGVGQLLGVSQQTVGRWETGDVEPGVRNLKQLAALYGSSLDDLAGVGDFFALPEKRQAFEAALDASAGHWGYFGLSWPGAWKTAWFPVCRWAADSFAATHGRRRWVVVPTLNNRVLVVNVASQIRFHLVPRPRKLHNDWYLPWDAESGRDLESYRMLAKSRFSTAAPTSQPSSASIDDLFAWLQQPESPVYSRQFIEEHVLSTRVHTSTGEDLLLPAEGPGLWRALCEAERDELSIVELRSPDRERRTYMAAGTVWLLDMPAIKVLEAVAKTQEPSS